MLRIAIADDEERIRLGLAKLVRAASDAYRVAGLFANGAELLRFVEAEGADLVITDIRMPVMDGLQVAEKLHAAFPHVRCIIVSGYNDFEYARTAFRHRVTDYLLKPLDKSELYRLLRVVEAEIREAKDRARAERRHMLERALAGESAAPLVGDDEYAVWYAVRTEHPMAVEALGTGWGHYAERAETVAVRDRLYGVLLRLHTVHMSEEAEEAGALLAARLSETTAAAVGASMPFRGSLRIKEAFAEAERAAAGAMYRVERTTFVMAAEAVEPVSTVRFGDRFKAWEDAFVRCLAIVDREGIESALIELFEELRRRREAPETVLACMERVLVAAEREIREFAEEALRTFGAPPDRRRTMTEFLKFDPLARWFQGRMAETIGRIRERRSGSARAVDEVKAYLASSYREELDLTKLAERVYLTPSYLSKLFKQETGMTITDYAIKVRIEEAKRLLRERVDLKTYEVGERVGYPDSAYFTKLFKRIVGLTPNEYRQIAR